MDYAVYYGPYTMQNRAVTMFSQPDIESWCRRPQGDVLKIIIKISKSIHVTELCSEIILPPD